MSRGASPVRADDLPRRVCAELEPWIAPVLRWCSVLGGADVDVEAAAAVVFSSSVPEIAASSIPLDLGPLLFQRTRRVVSRQRLFARVRRWVGWLWLLRRRSRRSPDVAAALNRLSMGERELLVLGLLERRPDHEVARYTGVPVAQVKGRLLGARARFLDESARLGLEVEATRPHDGADR